MEQKPHAIDSTKGQPFDLALIPDYVPAEVFLENIGYFTPSSKKIRGIYIKEKFLAEVVGEDGTKQPIILKISANHELGLPITADLDYYRSFLKILDDLVEKQQPITGYIEIPSKYLSNLAGKTWSIVIHREIRNWFARMRHTAIRGGVYNAERKRYEVPKRGMERGVFDEVVYRGEEKDGRIAESNYVKLSAWWLKNYLRHHVRPIDLNFHLRLRKPVAKSLYPLLETGWYASQGKAYTKSYTDLCKEFLLTHRRYLAEIVRQLDPAHKDLQKEKFLKGWKYTEAKSGGYNITYYPGEKFFHDQKARIKRRELAIQIDSMGGRARLPRHGKHDVGYVVDDILEITGDQQSRNYYTMVVRELGQDRAYMLLSETRQAARQGEVRTTTAKYFTDLAERALAQVREHKNQLPIFPPEKQSKK
jgi:hypothetical protein